MTIKKKSSETTKLLESAAGKLTLGNFLMAIRQGEELSQVEFAKLIGVSRQYLCDIEHGRRFLSPKMASEFAKTLGYSEQQFVRLCLQELVDREKLKLQVEIKSAA